MGPAESREGCASGTKGTGPGPWRQPLGIPPKFPFLAGTSHEGLLQNQEGCPSRGLGVSRGKQISKSPACGLSSRAPCEEAWWYQGSLLRPALFSGRTFMHR